ncbi:hypothetical protein OEZ86_008047 [Tetradesmus obliquus]|nr:hypothetical protein OEZ86_008047 [Tetradesmus obliquus]
MAAHDGESPELVRVKLCLSKEAPKQRAKIKRATKRHELVEVEDFQKAALQDKRAKLLQEEAHWLQLQQQYNDMHTAAAAGAPADPAAAEAETAEAEAAGTPRADATAAAAAAPLADSAAADTSNAGAPAAAAAAAAVAAAAAAGTVDAVAAGEAAAGDGPVCAQQAVKVRGVQLKVEMLLALVSKMEHLVASAETAARTLQAGYHAEKFKVFPHINSPAALIKSIIGSQHAAEAPGEGDGAGPSSGN